MKTSTVAAIAVVCAVIGFGLGYWPQAQQRKAAVAEVAVMNGEVESLKADLAKSTARVQISDILAQLLVLKDVVGIQNYGKAQELSSAWFDAVRALGQTTPDPGFRQALEASLAFRDPLTIALTRGDPGAMGILSSIEEPIRAALGFPAARIPPEVPAAPPAP
jgi:hypothetical protein